MPEILLALAATAALVAAGYWWSTRLLPLANSAERWTAACVCAFCGLTVATELLSVVSGIGRTGFLIASILMLVSGFAVRLRSQYPPDDQPSAPWPLRILLAFSIFVFSLIVVGALWRGMFNPVPIDTDGPIYHLPFAVRWLQEGSLTRVWTPFGELAATYFPGNGEIWLCWLLALVGDDRLAKVGQWFFLLPTVAAVYALGRSAGGDRSSSVWPPLCWLALPFVAHYSIRPNVDFPMTFLLIAGTVFLVRVAREPMPDSRRGPLFLAALSFGAAAGAKSVAILFAFLPLLAVLWLAHRSAGTMLQVLAAALIGGGYWYLRNWLETGNPLYPYRLSLGGTVLFDGWYDASVMRATSEYHIPVNDYSRALAILGLALPTPLLVALLLALAIGFGSLFLKSRSFPRASFIGAVLCLVWAIEYWFVQPYNTQPRFLLPALAVGFVPLAVLRGYWQILPAILLPAAMLSTFKDVSHLDWRYLVVGVVILVAAAFLAAFQPRLRPAVFIGSSLLSLLLAPTVAVRRDATPLFYSTRDFGERLFPAWLRLQNAIDVDRKGQGAVVGYAGTNLPYFLAGPLQKNPVRYVNVQGEASWRPHDHFRARRLDGSLPTGESAFPQWHRDRADRETWLRNLDLFGVAYFFIARENFHGRPDAPTGLPPFPVEYDWIVSMPERFERLGPPAQPGGAEPWGIAFRIRPAPRMPTN